MADEPVAVVGAGAVGINVALALAERGHSVAVYDPEPPASGASHGNAGVVSPWSCVPQSLPGIWRSAPRWLLDPEGPLRVRPAHAPRFVPWALRFLAAGRANRLPAIADAMNALSRHGVELYRKNLEGTGAEPLLVDAAYVQVARDRAGLGVGGIGWRLREDRGVPMEIVEGAALREIEPALGPDYTAAIVIEGQARALDPGAIGRALADKAKGLGASFHARAVAAIRPGPDGGWRLRLGGEPAEEHAAHRVVLAAGVWSVRLLAPLGVRVPLEAERGYHVTLAEPGIEIRNSVMDLGAKFVASSMADGVRCAGTAEFAGIDAAPDWRRADVLVRQAKRLFPALDTAKVSRWMGRRPSLPDSIPAIGPVPGHAGLFAAFGHCHYGFNQAPETGRLVARLLTEGRPNVDLSPFALERFA